MSTALRPSEKFEPEITSLTMSRCTSFDEKRSTCYQRPSPSGLAWGSVLGPALSSSVRSSHSLLWAPDVKCVKSLGKQAEQSG